MKDEYVRNAEVHLDEYHDGDTISVTLDLGCKVFKRERVRLAGINAPELYGTDKAKGQVARQWLAAKLDAATSVAIATSTGAYYDKYGRYLATVYADGENVNIALIEAGLATVYV